MTSGHPRQDSHAALDEAARRAHAASLDRLSPRVQAQLAQRRRAAMKQATAPAPLRAWPMLALGSAAALTLAVGLFVVRSTDEDAPKTAATVATAPTADTDTPAHSATITADTSTTPAPVTASAETPDVAVDDTAIDSVAIDTASIDSMLIEDDALPEELLAAEFGTADETMGFDALQESPDFYLWLGSEESQADVTESL